MDKLKSFIEDNKEEFNENVLPEDHFKRFQQKLPNEHTQPVRKYILFGLIAAASVALLILFSVPFAWIDNHIQNSYEVCESRFEAEELRLYYDMQMRNIVSEMENITENSSSPAVEGLMKASRQVLSATARFEKEILPDLPCSGDAIFVMNQHYTNSLESLRFMLEQMQQHTENKINN